MSHEIRRRGKNWYTAMGVLFIIMALIVIGRNLIIWGPEFVLDFFLNSELTNELEKVAQRKKILSNNWYSNYF